MTKTHKLRLFLPLSVRGLSGGFFVAIVLFLSPEIYSQPSLSSKIEGLLIGSAIGDAAGGPIEFAEPLYKSWDDPNRELTQEWLDELAADFRLREYARPAEPFGVWDNQPPAGTITDDTRLKMIFYNALKSSDENLTHFDIARAMLNYPNTIPEKYREISEEWLQEINYASLWVLGDTENGLPPERLWGGIPTVMGSMALLPVAAIHPADPMAAYKHAYSLAYFDNGTGKDINAALVAGLASALGTYGNWNNVKEVIRSADPFKYNETVYVNRATTRWLDKAGDIAGRAENKPAKLYELLESELETTYWWEAWVPLTVVFSIVEFVELSGLDAEPMAMMELVLEFGHDTDSYMQVMGAFIGAIYGKEAFPLEMRDSVNAQMKAQFGQNVNDWMEILNSR